jgi:hypothetical protein
MIAADTIASRLMRRISDEEPIENPQALYQSIIAVVECLRDIGLEIVEAEDGR